MFNGSLTSVVICCLLATTAGAAKSAQTFLASEKDAKLWTAFEESEKAQEAQPQKTDLAEAVDKIVNWKWVSGIVDPDAVADAVVEEVNPQSSIQ
jgi:hypothetical protein